MNSLGKVCGVGLGRTATKSLNRALKQLGLNTVHYPEDSITAGEVISGRPYSILETCDGITDLHATVRYREIDQLWPGSRFILTVREKSSWLASSQGHMEWYRDHPEPQPLQAMSTTLHRQAYGVDRWDEAMFSAAYDRHQREVEEYFRGRNNLLVMDIIAGDGWDQLCPFLGMAVPDRVFPRTR